MLAPLLATLLTAPTWLPFEPALFTRASVEHKLVLLDLQAGWCHWCHVMEQETYGDPAVAGELAAHFLCARVDQDAAPELSARYGDWGWPATIVLDAHGAEIVKRRGYLPRERMLALLQAIVADPSPGPSVVEAPPVSSGPQTLSAAQKAKAREDLDALYDPTHGGWGDGFRRVQPAELELALSRALAGDAAARAQVTRTLDGLRRLIDPVWGGLYQYSDAVDWSSPHFERLLTYQADGLTTFALAYAALGDPADRAAAHDILRYVERFLTAPDGTFFVSQDADLSLALDGHAYARLDDAARRAAGIPRIDTHVYPRTAGRYLAALADAARLLNEPELLARAERAEAALAALPAKALSDDAAMAAAELALYRATGRAAALTRSLDYLGDLRRFRNPQGPGFASDFGAGFSDGGALAKPFCDPAENALVARTAVALLALTGSPVARAVASDALQLVDSPEVLARQSALAPALLIGRDSASGIHVVAVGAATDPPIAELLHAARASPTLAPVAVTAWDPAGPVAPPSELPAAPTHVAYVCGASFCSAPARTPEALRTALLRQLARLEAN